jgi:hypothetical protein
MTDIQNTGIPGKSVILNYLSPVNYADSFKMKVPGTYTGSIDDLTRKSFGISPGWVNGLMKLRNAIVSPFGLKAGGEKQKSSAAGMLKRGDKAGIFTVIERTDAEIVMGEQDKHLDFCVSVYLDGESGKRSVTVTTIVKFNNLFGRLYFAIIRPFHRLIVPSVMKYNVGKL